MRPNLWDKTKIAATKPGILPITNYSTMKSLWLELDHYQSFKMESSEEMVKLQKLIERGRIFQFLAGLNAEYDQVCVQILGK